MKKIKKLHKTMDNYLSAMLQCFALLSVMITVIYVQFFSTYSDSRFIITHAGIYAFIALVHYLFTVENVKQKIAINFFVIFSTLLLMLFDIKLSLYYVSILIGITMSETLIETLLIVFIKGNSREGSIKQKDLLIKAQDIMYAVLVCISAITFIATLHAAMRFKLVKPTGVQEIASMVFLISFSVSTVFQFIRYCIYYNKFSSNASQ